MANSAIAANEAIKPAAFVNGAPQASWLAAIAGSEEKFLQARIGIAVLDKAGGIIAAWRAYEHFPLNSTYKPLLCAALLHKVDKGALDLSDKVRFDKSRLVSYSPVTQNFITPAAMDWRQLCRAAVEFSDNTAANLILAALGGPGEFNRFLRNMGDNITQLDHFEPDLNHIKPGDKRDSTMPVAIGRTLQQLVFGDILQPQSRRQLTQWLLNDKVADELLRSVLPPQWKIADKTGAGDYGSRSIISIIWPQKREPLLIAIYITATKASIAQTNAAIARIGKKIFTILAQEHE
ncbi:class A beta-lactamase [Candidatus Tokpelaia sp.]|nr:class A beta-lactamase [Candidatus Tokpelaia sp.]